MRLVWIEHIHKAVVDLLYNIHCRTWLANDYLPYQNHFGLTTGNDIGKAILTLPDGSIAIAATMDFGNSRTLISYLKVNNKGILKR